MDGKYVRSEFIVPRCTDACPAGVDVPRYIRAVKDGKYDEAVSVLREKLPLPTVCADACFAPCEDVCAYKQFGDPIAIRAIKRAAVDKGGDAWKSARKSAGKTGKKAAVVGAGPAGLTVAYYLAGKGHEVTLFDAFPKPGGAMRYGIPNYRLPEERLDKDISDILEMGVTFKGETVIGKDVIMDELKKNFDAIFLASGANGSARIAVEGSEKKGVFWGWDFLKDVALGETFDMNGDVVVVGGGNVAIDVALTARRLGAQNVQLFCLEAREEMPAHAWEIARAEEEGVMIHNGWGPVEVMGDKAAAGLRFQKCISVFDKSGKFSPEFDAETTEKAEGSAVILAVGQAADLGYVEGQAGIDAANSRIGVSENQATGDAMVFAGGDVVSGPDSIIGAIAQGRKAAGAMDAYLGGDGNIDEVLATPEDEITLAPFLLEVKSRNEMEILKPWARLNGFDQVEKGLSSQGIADEAARCLNCDARKFEVVLNMEYCKECGYCAEVCDVGTFGPASIFNTKGYRPAEVKSSDWCVGCFKCYFSCPDFAIDVAEITA
ncbi:MAG: FAD-dependent oxidoreductase [Deltaproteobacteria bacterium]|nr:FAD-dependent oxidoreductase [Deltaproteobacteria bacterium]